MAAEAQAKQQLSVDKAVLQQPHGQATEADHPDENVVQPAGDNKNGKQVGGDANQDQRNGAPDKRLATREHEPPDQERHQDRGVDEVVGLPVRAVADETRQQPDSEQPRHEEGDIAVVPVGRPKPAPAGPTEDGAFAPVAQHHRQQVRPGAEEDAQDIREAADVLDLVAIARRGYRPGAPDGNRDLTASVPRVVIEVEDAHCCLSTSRCE